MQIDFSVELGADDPVLEIPWKSNDGTLYYIGLKSEPERINELAELAAFPELKPLLLNLNQRETPLLTAKCDAWFSRDLLPEEDIFNAECKLVCYVDLVFARDESRCSFSRHEKYAKDVCAALKAYPEHEAFAELIIRRCYYKLRQFEAEGCSDSKPGEACFCFTLYVAGFGKDEAEARRRWAMALQLLQRVILQSAGTGP